MGWGAPGRAFEITEANRASMQGSQSSAAILPGERGEAEQSQLPKCLLGWGCLENSQRSELCWRQERDFLSTSPGLLPPALAVPRETCSAVMFCPSQQRCPVALRFSQATGDSWEEVVATYSC